MNSSFGTVNSFVLELGKDDTEKGSHFQRTEWTAVHIKWRKSLNPEALYKEILDEYLLIYTTLSDKLERLDLILKERNLDLTL